MDNPHPVKPDTISPIKIYNFTGREIVVKTKSTSNAGTENWGKYPSTIERNGFITLDTWPLRNLPKNQDEIKKFKYSDPNDICEINISSFYGSKNVDIGKLFFDCGSQHSKGVI